MAQYFQQTQTTSLRFIQTVVSNPNTRAYTRLRLTAISLGPGPQTYTLRTNSGIITDLVSNTLHKYSDFISDPVEPKDIPVSKAWTKLIIFIEKLVRRQNYGNLCLNMIIKDTDPLLPSVSVVSMRRDRFSMPDQKRQSDANAYVTQKAVYTPVQERTSSIFHTNGV